MKASGSNIHLSGYDAIFGIEETREETGREKVQMISLAELHPFAVNGDLKMYKNAEQKMYKRGVGESVQTPRLGASAHP